MDFQNHKGQEIVYHTQYHGKIRIHKLEWANVQQTQQVIEQTIILQNANPGLGAHQHVDPGRQRDDKNQLGAAHAGTGNGIGSRIAQQQTDNGGDDGGTHGTD